MKLQALLIVAVLAPLAGCLGIPEGAIAPGDNVSAVVTVTDAGSGSIIMSNQAVEFAVGSGASGLGFEFERRLIAKAADYTGELRITNDPSLSWEKEVAIEGVFEDDLMGEIDEDQFRQFFGEPVVGEEFEPQFSFYTFRVEAYEEGMVTYRVIPVDGQEDPVEYIGAILRTNVDEPNGILIQTLVANVGQTFQIAPPNQFNPNTPLGLEPGSYRAAGNDGTNIVYDYASQGNPDVIGRDLIIEVSVRNVSKGAGAVVEPVDGNYGVRSSPAVNGAPSDEPDYGAHS